jgi:hypothetical protein
LLIDTLLWLIPANNDGLIGQRKGTVFVSVAERVLQPLFIITLREVLPRMAATTFGTRKGGNGGYVGQF